MRIEVQELKVEHAHAATVDMLNRLLPQLTRNAPSLSLDDLREVLNSNTRLFAAVVNGNIVGVALLCSVVQLDGRRDRLENVVVDSGYRGHGIGKMLVLTVMDESAKQNARDLTLVTEPEQRPGAAKLYTSLGFTRRSDKVTFRRTH